MFQVQQLVYINEMITKLYKEEIHNIVLKYESLRWVLWEVSFVISSHDAFQIFRIAISYEMEKRKQGQRGQRGGFVYLEKLNTDSSI